MIVSLYLQVPGLTRDMLSYYVPAPLKKKIHLFQRVVVDLRGERVIGLIAHIRSEAPLSEKESLKPLIRIVDQEPVLNREQFDLSEQVARHYLCHRGEALFAMIPSGRREKQVVETPAEQTPLPDLNPEQEQVVNEALSAPAQGKEPVKVRLLHGVTGSGKTRIYIELIQKYLERKIGVIFLLPEIALSYQFLNQLKPIFGDQMAILHSGLGRSFRFSEYKRVLRGEALLVVGTRSSVFAPVRDLGLVIIDEEHDSSYKEHSSPRYHAKWVAYTRLAHKDWPFALPRTMLVGSATPSVETNYFARRGAILLHRLTRRATGMELPEVHVPLYDTGDTSSDILSPFLIEKMQEHLERGNQAMLLLNRRGYHNYAFCRKCEEPVRCPHCSVSMTFHRHAETAFRGKKEHKERFLKCHLCGFQEEFSGGCKSCGGKLRLTGKGIQKVEDALEFHFPGVEYARLDQDTSGAAGYTEDVLQAMRNGKIKILIGTQMIAKGFDLPGVTLVGLVNADIGLSLPDFRSSERVFQLLVQASGRAGRHSRGEVVMQTMQPHHYAIEAARNNDYETFYEREIEMRKMLNYPPFCRLFRIVCRGPFEDALWSFVRKLSSYLKEMGSENSLFSTEGEKNLPAEILGPVDAPIYRIKDEYRVHLIAKDRSVEKLLEFGRRAQSFAGRSKGEGIKVDYELDPLDLL